MFFCFAFLFYFDFQGSATFSWPTVLDIWLVQIFLPFNYSLLHLLLFLPVDDCAGFFSWSWHDRHRRAPAWQYYAHETLFLELGMSNLPSYLSKIFNMSINLSLWSFACFSAKCEYCLVERCRYKLESWASHFLTSVSVGLTFCGCLWSLTVSLTLPLDCVRPDFSQHVGTFH